MAVTQITASMLAPLRGAKRWAYLERARTIRFASANEDGSIYLSPLWLIVHEQRIYIPVDAASRHGANFEAGRPLSALVDTGDEFPTVAGVRILGKMVVVEDQELFDRLQGTTSISGRGIHSPRPTSTSARSPAAGSSSSSRTS